MREFTAKARAEGRTVVLVPTMGALHEGHLSLIDKARTEGDCIVVSIYVNPTQFGPNEDLAKYPRTLEADLEACRSHGVAAVFLPDDVMMYPDGYSTYVNEESVAKGMCGISRPVHFRGVCTVVTKLFNIVGPHVAVFGQKDAQQCAVIQRMVRDLDIPVRVVIAPTVREADGMALSSRNRYLSAAQRADALCLSESLFRARDMYEKEGVTNPDRLRAEITHIITRRRRMRVIYIEIVDRFTMEPVREIAPGRTTIALACWCDQVRLIDNIQL